MRDLPYQEQLYWQAFNEWPKALLSKRAITTDFKGEVYTEYDPLNALRRKIGWLDEAPPSWWNPRGQTLVKAVRYPVTNSSAEWSNEILALDQLLNEGFQTKRLRAIAEQLKRPLDAQWGAFKLIEECLVGSGGDEEEAKNAVKSLRTVRDLRNIVKGHGAPQQRAEMEKRARTNYGSFRAHFLHIAADCDEALDLIIRMLGAKKE